MTKWVGVFRIALAACCVAPVAQAGVVTFNASSGSRAAQAKFQDSGSDLIVTLTNTSTADALVPIDVLTGVFFSISGNPSLTRV